MDIWSWLKEVAILIVVYEITTAAGDFLESFRPKEDNPPELNEFLANVRDHKSDFSYVREAARKFQKMKKDIQSSLDPLDEPLDYYDDFFNRYRTHVKRHAHSYHSNKKFRSFSPRLTRIPQKKTHRFRRGIRRFFPQQLLAEMDAEDNKIQKRRPEPIYEMSNQKHSFKEPIPSQIFIEPEGEKLEKRMISDVDIEPEGKNGEIEIENEDNLRNRKEAMDFENAVHGTYKHSKEREKYNSNNMEQNKQSDFYYVDLADQARRNQERRYDSFPHRQRLNNRYNNRMANRPNVKKVEENFDYPIYETEPLHHNINDEVAFERALSYEIEPNYHEHVNNNPQGNNLYSVDEGRPDNVQLIPPQRGFQNADNGQSVTNEKFMIDASSPSTSISTNTPTLVHIDNLEATTDKIEKTTFIPVGKGFIEITKMRRDDERQQDIDEKSPLLMNSPQALVGTDDSDNKQKISSPIKDSFVVKDAVIEDNGKQMRESPRALEENDPSNKAEQFSIAKESSRSIDVEDSRNTQDEKMYLKQDEEPNDKLVQDNLKLPNDMFDNEMKEAFVAKSPGNEDNENLRDSINGDLDQSMRDSPRSLEETDLSKKENQQLIGGDNDQNDKESLLERNSFDRNVESNEENQQFPIKIKETSNENEHQSSILSKNSLHPLRVRQEDNEEIFQSRKLQFIDDENTQIDNQENDYKELPQRPRRDFLDALGMRNEEDYSEDNPYRDMATLNNTDVHNDTHCQNLTTAATHKCGHNTKTTTTMCPQIQKEDVKDIKEILEEPKEITAQNSTIGNFKKEKEEKEEKKRSKRMHSKIEDYNDVNEDHEIRRQRDTFNADTDTSNVAAKILQNKNKIYNQHEDARDRSFNNNHVQIKRTMSMWPENYLLYANNPRNSVNNFAHNIQKKEDNEVTESAVTSMSFVTNCTDVDVVNSTYEQMASQMDQENEKLAQVVNGQLATKIVSSVFDQVKSRNALKTKFYSGLSRKHVDFAGTIDFNIFKTNETDDANEARLLLDQITKVLNKLVLNQVRRKLCTRLPDELKDYIDGLLNVKNNVETTNYEPNTNQGNFLFKYQEQNEPPFNVKKLQETLIELEKLLLSYQNMNEDCQSRAEPVKDYIEKHVKMLKQMVSCPGHNCPNENMKRDTPKNINNNRLIEQQLESVGLGKKNEFIPNFDLGKLVKSKMDLNSLKINEKRDLKKGEESKSEKYRKLKLAAEKIRAKRENEKKIAELFGGKNKRSPKTFDVDYEEPVVYSLG